MANSIKLSNILSTTIGIDVRIPSTMTTAKFVIEADTNNAILGRSKHSAGVIGLSQGFTGVYGEGPFGMIGISNTDDGDGVSGRGRRGVVGESDTFQGVYGHSKKNAGVVGESDAFDGLWGIAHTRVKAGVFGLNKHGCGVRGHSETQIGVSGDSDSGIGVHGRGGSLAGQFEGDVEITGNIRMTGGADCAEEFDVAELQEVDPGTVMVLGDEGKLFECRTAYDKKVAGVISGAGDYKPAIVLDKKDSSENRQPIALLGKTYCKVDAQFGSIEVGDLLTTSPTPGYAMKASEPGRAFGAIIGKALRPLNQGYGLIPILITLQ